MVNEITRFLVDKKKMIVEGRVVFRLYFFDSNEGVIITFDAPVFKYNRDKLMDEMKELPKLEDIKDDIEKMLPQDENMEVQE